MILAHRSAEPGWTFSDVGQTLLGQLDGQLELWEAHGAELPSGSHDISVEKSAMYSAGLPIEIRA